MLNITKKQSRDLIFQIMKNSKLHERFDTSDEFWDNFNVHNPKLKKQVGLYETESMINPNMINIAVNLK